jgi:DNA repair exonuclease SbcCD ATPase subunit
MAESTLDWIEQAGRAGAELKALIREAHEATRDLRTVLRELAQAERSLDERLERARFDFVAEVIRVALADVAPALDSARDAIERRAAKIEEELDAVHRAATGVLRRSRLMEDALDEAAARNGRRAP